MRTIEQLTLDLYKREGGYVNNALDKGGPTNKGVTEQVARAYGYTGSMRDIPEDIVREIYKRRYWLNVHFDKVAALMPRVGEELFDTGVNMGPRVAAIFFQRILNVANRRGTDYPDVPADGDIGPMTLSALAALKNKRVDAERVMLKALNALQGAKYIGIAEANPSQEVFFWGWMGRVGEV